MASTLYPDDVVASVSQPLLLAVIERTHGSVDTHQPDPASFEEDDIIQNSAITTGAFRNFLYDGVPPKGAVLVRWTHSSRAELMPEAQLSLQDRCLLIGDVVKRDPRDAISGVVLNVFTKCTLQPMCSFNPSRGGTLQGLWVGGHPPTEDAAIETADFPPQLTDIPVSELDYAVPASVNDMVVYKDWLGKIVGFPTIITLRLPNNSVVEVNESALQHLDGNPDMITLGDLVRTKKSDLRTGRWIFGQYNPNVQPLASVVHVRHSEMQVTWLQRRIGSLTGPAPPRVLERDHYETSDFMIYQRDKWPMHPPREPTVSNSEIDTSIGLRVRFKDLPAACEKYNGSTSHGKLTRIPRTDTLGYDLNAFDVVSSKATVTVQWQDLSITSENSTSLVPDASIDDEHAAWPGEIVHTVDCKPVAGMPGTEAPSKVGVVQTVRAEERMARIRWCPSACVQYSQYEDDVSDGLEHIKPVVHATIGVATGEVEELSLYDVETPASLNTRRGDIVLVNTPYTRPSTIEAGAHWLGEIVDDRLDGTLLVRLGLANPILDVVLRREQAVVVVRSDGTDEADAMTDDMMDEYEDDRTDAEIEAGVPRREVTYENENGDPMEKQEVEDEEWESEDEDGDTEMRDGPERQALPELSSATSIPATTQAAADEASDSEPVGPEAYSILDSSVPWDHHFADEASSEASDRAKRVQKEHKILQKPGAIPDGVYIRTWSSRLDLLRILFVGPEDTPYADAPFVMDFYFPTNYPYAPPKAYFHSWPGENGLGGASRVNPNLYTDGKICLSLLGTWSGNAGESWNAARSTFLQVIVSLLGLVLVKEPYFNEAGYEHLSGLDSSKRASALYNERTFLRARTFVISALAALRSGDRLAGLDGLKEEVEWLYLAPRGPKLLQKISKGVQAVLQRSDEETAEPDGLTVMSKGACIPLRRALGRLQELLP